NDGVQVMFGYSESQVGSQLDWWRERIHTADRERVVQHLKAAAEGEAASLSFEYRFRRADGSYATVLDRAFGLRDGAGNPPRMLGSMVDLTQRRRAEEQIRDQAALLDKARDAIVVSDLVDGHIRFWSQGAERIYGWTAGEALGQEALRLFQGDSSAAREAWRH